MSGLDLRKKLHLNVEEVAELFGGQTKGWVHKHSVKDVEGKPDGFLAPAVRRYPGVQSTLYFIPKLEEILDDDKNNRSGGRKKWTDETRQQIKTTKADLKAEREMLKAEREERKATRQKQVFTKGQNCNNVLTSPDDHPYPVANGGVTNGQG